MLDGREHGGIIAAVGRHMPEARAVYTRVLTAANRRSLNQSAGDAGSCASMGKLILTLGQCRRKLRSWESACGPCRAWTCMTRGSSGCIMCGMRMTVCHERTDGNAGAETAREMRVGPSEPAVRSRLQTTASCGGKEPLW